MLVSGFDGIESWMVGGVVTHLRGDSCALCRQRRELQGSDRAGPRAGDDEVGARLKADLESYVCVKCSIEGVRVGQGRLALSLEVPDVV